MSQRLISLFTFGILLILIGAVGSFYDWSQSNLFIGMGLTMESLALVLFAWNRIRKR
jgi:Kef-type K+ transport system membrane component KefB